MSMATTGGPEPEPGEFADQVADWLADQVADWLADHTEGTSHAQATENAGHAVSGGGSALPWCCTSPHRKGHHAMNPTDHNDTPESTGESIGESTAESTLEFTEKSGHESAGSAGELATVHPLRARPDLHESTGSEDGESAPRVVQGQKTLHCGMDDARAVRDVLKEQA